MPSTAPRIPARGSSPVHQPEWISIARLAERLDVRVDHLRSLVSRREIPFGRVGRLVRFHWPTVDHWLRSSVQPVALARGAPRPPARVDQ